MRIANALLIQALAGVGEISRWRRVELEANLL